MKSVMTVLGSVGADALGFTDMHEHVMMDGGWVLRERLKGQPINQDERYSEDDPVRLENIGLIKRNFVSNWDGLSFDDEALMRAEVGDYRQSGGRTLLELSVPGIRTKVPAIRRISEETDTHIIVSTGLYTGDSWPQRFLPMREAELRAYMLDEIRNGIEETGIRPGHIKIAIHNLMEHEELALRAAAKVANETGLGMTIHCVTTNIGGGGPRVVRILREEEVDLSRVVIAHASASFFSQDMRELALHPERMGLRLDYCKELLSLGANISLEFSPGNEQAENQNHVNRPCWVTLAGVIALIRQGYTSQIVLGTDTCAKVMTRRYGGEGYCRLTRFAIPKLAELGVSDYDIRMMTVKNPARILTY